MGTGVAFDKICLNKFMVWISDTENIAGQLLWGSVIIVYNLSF